MLLAICDKLVFDRPRNVVCVCACVQNELDLIRQYNQYDKMLGEDTLFPDNPVAAHDEGGFVTEHVSPRPPVCCIDEFGRHFLHYILVSELCREFAQT